MREPRTLYQYRSWFVDWAGWTGMLGVPECTWCGASGETVVNLGTVMVVARKKGHEISVEPYCAGWQAEVVDGAYHSFWGKSRSPVYAALRALYQAVKENE